MKAGQTMVVKPNISFDSGPMLAPNTSPELVARVIKHCLDAGTKRVLVMDHSIEYWERSLAASGIGDALKAADAASALMLGRKPSDIGHIRMAAEAGFGKIDLTKLKINRLTV